MSVICLREPSDQDQKLLHKSNCEYLVTGLTSQLDQKSFAGRSGAAEGTWAVYEAKEGSQLSMKFMNKLSSSLGDSDAGSPPNFRVVIRGDCQ